MSKKKDKPEAALISVKPEQKAAVLQFIRSLDEIANRKPPKPIKRKLKLTAKDLDVTEKLITTLAPRLRAVEKERDRISDLLDTELRDDDVQWLDDELSQLSQILDMASQELMVDY